MGLINFHIHSEFSFLGSLIRVEDLVAYHAFHQFPGCAITDTLSTYGYYQLTKFCEQEKIKPVYGIELFIQGVGGKGHYPLILIALNNQGLNNIFKLNSLSHQNYYKRKFYSLNYQTLTEHSQGLCALTAGEFYFHRNDFNYLKTLSQRLLDIFQDNLYVDVSFTGVNKAPILRELINIAENFQLTPIASCGARYFKEDKKAFDFLDSYRKKSLKLTEKGFPIDTDQDYSIRNQKEMRYWFTNHPEYLDTAEKLFEKIDARLDLKSFKIPRVYNSTERLKQLVRKRLRKKFNVKEKADEMNAEYQKYSNRLEYELKVIYDLELDHFFMIVSDIARFIKVKNIPLGYGRGSSVSSLTLYLLGATKVDPVKHNLMFERFINPGRKELPDIDMDIGWKRRNELFDYLYQKFGIQNVARLATVGRLMARSAMREISKAYKLPKHKLSRIMKYMPNRYFFSPDIDTILKQNTELSKIYITDTEIGEFLDILMIIEGLSSHSSVHAGGLMILPRGIDKFASTEYSRNGQVIAQITKSDLENTGFIKFDLLGLRFITIVAETMRRVRIKKIRLKDEKAYDLLCKGDTVAVFQLESNGMRDLIKKICPDSLERISDVIALYRPGPLKSGMTEQYISRHKGREKTVIDDVINDITGTTYGLFVYQEQIIRLAHEVAGLSWEESDLLRKALSSKKKELIHKLEVPFLEGCSRNGLSQDYAQNLFELLISFGSYSFNKSHSIAYAYNAYAGAYLKANYPRDFYLVSLNNNIGYVSRLNRYLSDAKFHKIPVFGIDINHSEVLFSLSEGIVGGLITVKYVGQKVAVNIVKERRTGGIFTDFLNFYLRMKPKGLNSKAAEYLIRAGAFDDLGYSRKTLLIALGEITQINEREIIQDRQFQSDSLFMEPIEGLKLEIENFIPQDKQNHRDTEIEKFDMEIDATELYLSRHPLDKYEEDMDRYRHEMIAEIDQYDYVVLIAYLQRVREIKTKNGEDMAFITFSDTSGICEAVCFPKNYNRFKHIIRKGDVYLVKGPVEDGKLQIEELFLFDKII